MTHFRWVMKGSGDKEVDELRGVCGVEWQGGVRKVWNQERRFCLDSRAAHRCLDSGLDAKNPYDFLYTPHDLVYIYYKHPYDILCTPYDLVYRL